MDEQQTTEQVNEPTNDDTQVGTKTEGTELIQGAEDAAKRLEEANQKQEALLDRQEALMAKQALGGRSEGGQVEAKKEPLTDIQFAEAVQRGEINPLKEDGII